jgi:hypothetical protein
LRKLQSLSCIKEFSYKIKLSTRLMKRRVMLIVTWQNIDNHCTLAVFSSSLSKLYSENSLHHMVHPEVGGGQRKKITGWMIDYLRFYVLHKNFSPIWRHHHYWWRAAKFRPMLSAQGLWAGRGLYCATPAVTRGLSFSSLIRRTTPFSRLLQHKGMWRVWSCNPPLKLAL